MRHFDFGTTEYPLGSIIYVNDGYHQKNAPYMVISDDDYRGFGKPLICLRVTSKDKSESYGENGNTQVPIFWNGKISYVDTAEAYGILKDQISGSPVAAVYKSIVDLCTHLYASRFSMYNRKSAFEELEAYREGFEKWNKDNNFDSQTRIKKKISVTVKVRDVIENAITPKDFQIPPKYTRDWSTPQLIGWTNDRKNLSLSDVMKKYGIAQRSYSVVKHRDKSVFKEIESRGLLPFVQKEE